MRSWIAFTVFGTVAMVGLGATDLDGETSPPALVGKRDEVACRFTASDGFDDGPRPLAFDLRAMAQDATLYFAEMASAVPSTGGKPPSGEAVAQQIESQLNSVAHHRRNYWRRRRSKLFDQRRMLAEATGRVFKSCGALPTKTPEVTAACDRLAKDRATLEKALTPEETIPAKLEALEKETREAAVATKEAADLLDHAVGAPFFELEKALNKEFDKFTVVSRAKGVVESRKGELQDKLAVAESELYRLEDEVHRNTEAQEDLLETQIEELKKQIEKLNNEDDVKLESAFLPMSWRDSPELKSIKADKKAKEFIAKNGVKYRNERAKYRATAEELDHEAARADRIAKFDPSAAFLAPRLATVLLERGEELPVAISYVIEANPALGQKPAVASTTLLCGRKKNQEGIAFLASWTPPKPQAPPAPKPAPAPRGKRSLAASARPKAAAWPSPSLQTRAAERAGLEEAIVCTTWTLFCDRPPAVETAPTAPPGEGQEEE